ncbi:MAG: S1 RNA-binding domain-containing protein [Candidatus Yanofskybacteria bacterium]|nr:S1 RNA-binding domain-containing protein [Candidatus Yanofskybacteria bacterium]
METSQFNTTSLVTALDAESMKDILVRYETGLPKRGDVLTGEIISSSKGGIMIDLGSLGTGVIYPSEFYDNPSLHKSLKKGDSVSVVLLELENEEGFREVSLRQAQMTTAWDDIKEKKEKGEVIQTQILNINKGGLIVTVNGIQGFLPLSQLGPEHYPKIEGGDTTKIVQALQKFRGQTFTVKILDFSETEGKLIVSEKAILTDKLKEEVAKFKVGDVVEGTVTDITDFGAFIKITENIEGLIHISEIDWKIVENPRDYMTTGEKISAKIVNIDNGRISLSLKALREDPWEKIEESLKVGQTVEGEIAKITNYGLLIKINDQIIGLVPANELANKKDWSPKTGEKISVAIVSIEPKDHKMLLTIQGNKDIIGENVEEKNAEEEPKN